MEKIIAIVDHNPIRDTSNVEVRIDYFRLGKKTISVTTHYKDGKIHRDNGQPAVISDDGHTGYYENGVPHCDFGPAIKYANGGELHFYEGKLHNELGPALLYSNGHKQYWIHGERLTQDEFFERYHCE